MKRTRSLSARSLWLLVAMVVAKGIGAAYRLPLTNLLGTEGMGGYQLVFPVYALLLALSSTAVPTMLSRQIVRSPSFGYAVFRRALTLMLWIGLGATLLLSALAVPLSSAQGYPAMWRGYLALAPALLFVALAAPFRGWLQANLHTGALSGAVLVEQLTKLCGLGFAYLLRTRSLALAVAGALFGVTLSELLCFLWVLVAYRALGYRLSTPSVLLPIRPVLKATLPYTLSSAVMPVVGFFDSLLLVRLFSLTMPLESAVSGYGLLTGAVGTLVNLPVVLTLAFVTTVIPLVARALSSRSLEGVRSNSSRTLLSVLCLSLPSSVLLALLAPRLLPLLYPTLSPSAPRLGSFLLALSAATVPLTSLGQVYAALLGAVDRAGQSARNQALAGGAKLLASLALIPLLGLYGAVAAQLVCHAVYLCSGYLSYRHRAGALSLSKPMLFCTLSTLVMALVVSLSVRFIPNNLLCVALNVLLAGAVYAILLKISGVSIRHADKEKTHDHVGRNGNEQR